jgi:uncharacterized Zn-binding protein involved in type VI secretion
MPGGFDAEIVLTGPVRAPAQMLGEQTYDGHASVHDDATAASLGLRGAPIEGPTHFSQFDPLAVALWGDRWFEQGCISAHFQNMVVEGDQVTASVRTAGGPIARIGAVTSDGRDVLSGTVSVGPDHGVTECEARLARSGSDLPYHIVDRLELGMRVDVGEQAMTPADSNGHLYPFSLAQKLSRITERHPWYDADSPWGAPVVPFEMVSVLALRRSAAFPVRTPSLGLFLDLEVRMHDGPVLVGEPYRVEHEVVGFGQSRRTESYWTRTSLSSPADGRLVATVLLHQGVFKDSYPGYPEG